MATITSAIDEEIGKLKDTIIIRLDNGQEAKITHAKRILEGLLQCRTAMTDDVERSE